jgi:hypothetical protein
MVLAYLSPSWFIGYDVVLESLFAIVSLVVSIFSYRLYRDTDQRLLKYFSLSFGLIAISYLIQSALNFLIVNKLSENVSRMAKFQTVNALNEVGVMVHMFFMTLGLSILLYTTLKDKRLRTLWILMLTPMACIFVSTNTMLVFYTISSIYLAFISWHYLMHYLDNKQARTLLVALAFAFLLFGSFHYLTTVNHQLFYAIGHILELFAYLLILLNLYLVRK